MDAILQALIEGGGGWLAAAVLLLLYLRREKQLDTLRDKLIEMSEKHAAADVETAGALRDITAMVERRTEILTGLLKGSG